LPPKPLYIAPKPTDLVFSLEQNLPTALAGTVLAGPVAAVALGRRVRAARHQQRHQRRAVGERRVVQRPEALEGGAAVQPRRELALPLLEHLQRAHRELASHRTHICEFVAGIWVGAMFQKSLDNPKKLQNESYKMTKQKDKAQAKS